MSDDFPFSVSSNHQLPREPHKSSLLAEMPTGIDTKEALLETLAALLHFPAHFGKNWDALEEMLRDFSWLAESQTHVEIAHGDLPLSHSESDQRIYLQILANALHHWLGGDLLTLKIAFPAKEKAHIAMLLSSK